MLLLFVLILPLESFSTSLTSVFSGTEWLLETGRAKANQRDLAYPSVLSHLDIIFFLMGGGRLVRLITNPGVDIL